jgi:hypothetical protein
MIAIIQSWERLVTRQSPEARERDRAPMSTPVMWPTRTTATWRYENVAGAIRVVVDRSQRRPEQIAAATERIGHQGPERLSLDEQKGEIVRRNVGDGDRDERVSEAEGRLSNPEYAPNASPFRDQASTPTRH